MGLVGGERRLRCSISAGEGLLGGWSSRVGRLVEGSEEKHVGGVVAEGDAVFFEGEDDAAAEFAEDAVALVGADAELNEVGDVAAVDLIDAEDSRGRRWRCP